MEEQLIVCDEQGKEQFQETRAFVHQKGLWHKVIHVWIYENGNLYFQQRAMTKKAFPGGYDITIAGHMDPQETPVQTACRECREELGIKLYSEHLTWIGRYKEMMIHKDSIDCEIADVYLYNHEITSFSLGEEVIDLGNISICELRQLLEDTRPTCTFHSLHTRNNIRLSAETLFLHERSYYEWILHSL